MHRPTGPTPEPTAWPSDMTWIKLHQSVAQHRKTLEMADGLGVEHHEVIGHLSLLWLWALDNSSDGLLLASPRTLARVANWKGDAQAFVDAAVATGFLDRDAAGALTIHDWSDHMGALLEKREADAQRKAEERRAKKSRPVDIHRTSTGHPTPVQRTSGVEKSRVEKSRADQTRADAQASPSQARAPRSRAAVAATRPRVDPPEPLKKFAFRLAGMLPEGSFNPTANFYDDVQRLYAHLDLLSEATKMVSWWNTNYQRKKYSCPDTFALKWLERKAAESPVPRPGVIPFRGKPCDINGEHAAHKPWELCPDGPPDTMSEVI